MFPTLNEVAKRAGFRVRTVSKVINGGRGVGETTRKKGFKDGWRVWIPA
ncbi:LacI family DNA-binding transcriptional regulator [Candidatus Caldatribacterium saccharofermentans]|uniref:LacI family transcriptional regulator n=1 Tax=Candidatus Caldatribacterium saccharofermentans TaxID=1454753 RepID=A0A7V4TFJ6_9BACT